VSGEPQVAVAAVAAHDDAVLLVRRGRDWHLPGGMVRMGEDLREALVREVLDATALEVVVVEFAGWWERVEPDAAPPIHVVTLAFEVDLLDPAQIPASGATRREVEWVPREDLAERPLAPPVADLLADRGLLVADPGIELRGP